MKRTDQIELSWRRPGLRKVLFTCIISCNIVPLDAWLSLNFIKDITLQRLINGVSVLSRKERRNWRYKYPINSNKCQNLNTNYVGSYLWYLWLFERKMWSHMHTKIVFIIAYYSEISCNDYEYGSWHENSKLCICQLYISIIYLGILTCESRGKGVNL